MKIKNENRLAFFSDLYENAKMRYAPTLERMERCMAQYCGDDAIDNSHERASIVRNITYELIEAEITSVIPHPRVSPAIYSEKQDRNAKAAEELCSMLHDLLPLEDINDRDERYTYVYGGSVYYMEWDETLRLGGDTGGVRLYCLPPAAFIPEPYITEVEDMEYCFLRFNTTRDELCRRYGVSEEKAAAASSEAEAAALGDDDLVTVVTCFYKDENGEIGKYVFSGDAEISDCDGYYHRKAETCPVCGKARNDCFCGSGDFVLSNVDSETLLHDIRLSDGRIIPKMSPIVDEFGNLVREGEEAVMRDTEVPYFRPRVFPIVIRRNVTKDGELFGESDCAVIRPQQQALNKVESRIMQKLMRAGVTPVVPDDAEITLTNAIFGQVLKTRPGENAGSYGILDTTPAIAQDVAEAERLYLQAKRIIGISDTYIGLEDATAMSGRAKEIQIAQAAGRLESKKRMKNAAYAKIDRILFELYLAYADEPRFIPFRDMYGRRHNAVFNRYDYLEFDEKTATYFYDDAFLFSVDTAGGAAEDRESLWERNLQNLKAGTIGDPTSPETLLRYWQQQERAHYPYASDNVAYFRTLCEDSEKTGGGAI